MVTYRGYKTSVQYGTETAYGTGATTSVAIEGKIQTATVNSTNNLIRLNGLGEGRNETFVGFGNFECTWSMEIELASFNFLQYAIGPRSGSGTAIAPYYLEEADFRGYTGTTLASFGMELAALDYTGGTHNVDVLSGCVINTVGLQLNVGQTLKCSIEGYAKKPTSGTSATAYTPDTTKPWIFSQGVFKWNGTTVARVTNATINISNNYDPDTGRELGSRFPTEMEPGLRKYDWTITVKMTSAVATTLRDDFYGIANTPSDGVISAEPTFRAIILSLSEGAASTNRNAQILLTDCAINDISKPINIGDNIVELTINGTAKKGTTDTVNKPIKWWTVP